MNGPEHYAEAERLTAASGAPMHDKERADLLREALVHATLAAAAATVDARRGGVSVWGVLARPA